VDVVLFSRVWQTFSWSQRYILRGVLVEQTLENKPTAGLGWNSFGDVILKRTPVTSGKAKDMSLGRRAVPPGDPERRKGADLRSQAFFSRRQAQGAAAFALLGGCERGSRENSRKLKANR